MSDMAATGTKWRWRVLVDTRTGITLLNVLTFLLLQGCYSFGLGGIFHGYEAAFEPVHFIFGLVATPIISQLFHQHRSVSGFFLHFGMVCIVIPTLVLNSNGLIAVEFVGIVLGAYILLGLVTRIRMTPPLFVWPWRLAPVSMLWLLVFASMLFLGGLFALGGMRLNFSLAQVYELRSEAENFPPIYRYLMPMFSQAILPFGMVIALAKRRWLMLSIFVAVSVLIFATTGNKGPLFYPLLVVGVYYLWSLGRLSLLFSIVVVACLVLSLYDLALYAQRQSPFDGWIGALVVDRVLMLPNLLNFYYWEFFSTNGTFYFWSGSRITLGLLAMPYEQMAPAVIGAFYFPSYQPYANTGWIGAGFAEAGVIGVLVYSVGIGLIFSFADAVATRFGTRIAVSLFIIHASNLLNSIDFVQSFLTGGALVTIILVILTGSPEKWRDTPPPKAVRA